MIMYITVDVQISLENLFYKNIFYHHQVINWYVEML